MKAGELIEVLSKFPASTEVCIYYDSNIRGSANLKGLEFHHVNYRLDESFYIWDTGNIIPIIVIDDEG